MYEERIEKAVDYFKQGYNCSQSVVAAFADLYGIDHNLAVRMAASFGGGIGRMRRRNRSHAPNLRSRLRHVSACRAGNRLHRPVKP